MANQPIAAIAVEFQQHTTAIYWQVHHKINAQYGGLIHDFDDLFSDDKRIHVPALLTSKVIELMNLPTENDVARANQMCNSGVMTLRWYKYRPETYCCLNKLDYVINNAIKTNKQCLHLIININRLHFKENFKANKGI